MAYDTEPSQPLEPGTRVEVLNQFNGDWNGAFEIADRTADGYQVRRLSDGQVLPEPFPSTVVRRAR